MQNSNEKFDRIKADCNTAHDLLDKYDNPAVQTMVSVLESFTVAIPGVVSLVNKTIGKAISDFQSMKQKELLEFIIKNNNVTTDQINDVEFVMNLCRTCEAVNRLSTNDKVQYYGNLLRNGYLSDVRIDNNVFDECFEYIGSMSYREILWLWKYREFCGDELQNNEKWYDFKRTLSKETGVDENVIACIFSSLMRTGFLYQPNVVFPDGKQEDPYLISDLYILFSEYVMRE